MNCPSRVDPVVPEGYNQNPDALNADATTRADSGHVANARTRRDHCIHPADGNPAQDDQIEKETGKGEGIDVVEEEAGRGREKGSVSREGGGSGNGVVGMPDRWEAAKGVWMRAAKMLRTYAKFVGPGFMVAVAYIDPGAYCFSTCSRRHLRAGSVLTLC